MTGARVDGLVPEEWRDYATHRIGGTPPDSLTDGPVGSAAAGDLPVRAWDGGNGGSLDRAVSASREAVFGYHDLVA